MRTWYSAIILAIQDGSSRGVQLQDIYSRVDRYRPLSGHDREPHPKYPQENFKHTVRAYIKVLKDHGFVDHVARAVYSLTPIAIKNLDAFDRDNFGKSASRSGKVEEIDISELLKRLRATEAKVE